MSEYVVCETEFKDLDVLVAALVDVGVKAEHVELHEEAKQLEGYMGDIRKQRAHVVIRRRHVGGCSNDIGFERTPSGTYKAWVSDYDRSHGVGKKIMSGNLTQHYAKQMILRQASRTYGHKVKSCVEKNGKIRIKIGVR